MAQTLLFVGIACVVAAIVGGGFKGLGVEIPIVSTLRRQILLAVMGGVLGAAAGITHYGERPTVDMAEILRSGIEAYDRGDFMIAASRFSEAAKYGDAEAKYHYGEMLYHGEGVMRDEAKGVEFVRASAEAGFSPAQSSLAAAYAKGTGVERNVATARYWANLSAAQGNPDGHYVLGATADNPTEKEKEYRAAALKGHDRAQEALGDLYLQRGIVQIREYEKAREGGKADAKKPPQADFAEAARWFKEAGDRGRSSGMCLQAWAAEQLQNYEVAYTAALICRQGEQKAESIAKWGDKLSELESKMAADSVQRAIVGARAYAPRSPGVVRHTHPDWRTATPVDR